MTLIQSHICKPIIRNVVSFCRIAKRNNIYTKDWKENNSKRHFSRNLKLKIPHDMADEALNHGDINSLCWSRETFSRIYSIHDCILFCFWNEFILTLNVPYISESYIEIKMKVKFIFSHFFVLPQKVLWRPLRSVTIKTYFFVFVRDWDGRG